MTGHDRLPRRFITLITGLGILGGVLLWASPGLGQELRESSDPYYQPDRAGRGSADSGKLPQRAPDKRNQFRPLDAHQPNSLPASPPRNGAFVPPGSAPGKSLQQAAFTQPEKTIDSPRAASVAMQAQIPDTVPGKLPETLPGQRFEPGRVLARVGGHPIFVSDMSVEDALLKR